MGFSTQIILILILSWVSLVSCTISAEIINASRSLTVVFTSPEKALYTSELSKTARWNSVVSGNSKFEALRPSHYKVELFTSPNCQGTPHETTTTTDDSYLVASMAHGITYSLRVTPVTSEGQFPPTCSPEIVVDLVPPSIPTLSSPASASLTGEKEINFIWTPAMDSGTGLNADTPYLVELYEGENCSGTMIRSESQKDSVYRAESLEDGKKYSLKIRSRDLAGNLSAAACSNTVEVDSRIPQLALTDATSRNPQEVSRSTTVTAEITNPGQASYFCITEDLSFQPVSATEVCPQGGGTYNGWYTSLPNQVNLSAGDGAKNLHLWIADQNGATITPHPGVASILLDATLPGNFAVNGIGGGSDATFDAWLRTTLTPTLRWTASADTYEYAVEIRDNANNVICPEIRVPAPTQETTLVGCTLEDQKNYSAEIKSIDNAGNITTAAPFSFTTNNVPPGLFQILGIRGGNDALFDDWLGSGEPVLSWNTSNRADFYELQIINNQDQGICALQTINAPGTEFDYNSTPGACQPFADGGSYKILLTSGDLAGNRTNADNTAFLFKVDRSAPSLSIQNEPTVNTSNTSLTLNVGATDALSGVLWLQCRMDAGAYQDCLGNVSYSGLTEGLHTFSLRSSDRAGNINTDSRSWVVDTSAPTVSFTSTPAVNDNVNSGQFTFEYSDTYSTNQGFTCLLDGVPMVPCFSPYLYGSLSEGSHTFTVYATDVAGNNSNQISHSWKVDLTGPTINLTSTPANPSHSEFTADFSFTVTDAVTGVANIQCQLDGGTLEACATSKSYVALSTGNHTFQVISTDNAGNTFQQSYSWTIYSYSWNSAAWGACSAPQPAWNTGVWSGCSVGQPAYQYSVWGSCSVTCGGGTRTRTQTCPVVNGTQTRTVTCPTTSGTQTRTVTCQRNDGLSVDDSFCLTAKPATSQSCNRNDCPTPAPDSSQSCSRGGGTDCNTPQATSEACNTQDCCATSGGSNMCAGYIYCANCGTSAPTVCASGSATVIGTCGDGCTSPYTGKCQCN